MAKISLMAYGKLSNGEAYATCGVNKRAKYDTFKLHRLPTDIVRAILSRLPFKEAARTSLVSRRWRRLWRCYPKLILTRDTMLHGNTTNNNPTHIQVTFIGRVNSVVRQLKSATLSKFVVKFPLLQRDAHHIDRWVSLSVESRARRIILDLCPETEDIDRNDDMYNFPCICSPVMIVGFTNLKKLGLHMVSISGDLQCLLPHCDVLEWLSLTCCSLQNLSISRPLCRLRYLRVQHCTLQKLDMQAPNLKEFELTNYPIPLVLGECLNLSVATIMLLSSEDCFDYVSAELPAVLCHVQDSVSISLTIRNEVRGSAEGVARFNNLKHLILNIDVQGYSGTGSGILRLASLLKLAPVLEELELNMYNASPPIYIRQLDKTSMLCPHTHLRIVRMTGFYGIRGQLELALHILRSVSGLERMIIDPMVRVAWGPCLDMVQAHLMEWGRIMAQLRLREYRRIVTIL
ncbi:hypothetical protein ACP70R_008230 [Stipagrostis hirtigluma subsp. patula]